MNERKGWMLVFIGAALLFLVCLATSGVVFLWSSAFLEGILR